MGISNVPCLIDNPASTFAADLAGNSTLTELCLPKSFGDVWDVLRIEHHVGCWLVFFSAATNLNSAPSQV
jgi:hypothetical protein